MSIHSHSRHHLVMEMEALMRGLGLPLHVEPGNDVPRVGDAGRTQSH